MKEIIKAIPAHRNWRRIMGVPASIINRIRAKTSVSSLFFVLWSQNGNWFTPANWNGYVYFGEMNESVMAFNFANGLLPSSPSSQTTKVFGYPGASATVSANGTSTAIVWVLDNSRFVGGDLVGGVNTP